MEYFENQAKGYAIGISKTRKYQTPLSLNDIMLSLPPQSFMYLHTDPMDYIFQPTQRSSSNPRPFPALALG